MQISTCLGYTEVGGTTSDVLQKVQLDIINNQQCKDLYNDEDNYNIFRSQICAGLSNFRSRVLIVFKYFFAVFL